VANPGTDSLKIDQGSIFLLSGLVRLFSNDAVRIVLLAGEDQQIDRE